MTNEREVPEQSKPVAVSEYHHLLNRAMARARRERQLKADFSTLVQHHADRLRLIAGAETASDQVALTAELLAADLSDGDAADVRRIAARIKLGSIATGYRLSQMLSAHQVPDPGDIIRAGSVSMANALELGFFPMRLKPSADSPEPGLGLSQLEHFVLHGADTPILASTEDHSRQAVLIPSGDYSVVTLEHGAEDSHLTFAIHRPPDSR